MAFQGYDYTIEGETYVDLVTAADWLKMSAANLRNLMRGVEWERENALPFVRKGNKIFFKKDKLKTLKFKDAR